MERFFFLVAGVDREAMKECPPTDRILARQLGVMLSLTFVIIATITFYSLTYISRASVEYDVATNSFQGQGDSFGWYGYLIAGLVAVVVASVVTLFDRMIYQSDWFYQLPLADVKRLGQSARARFLWSKTWRVIVRLTISIAVAYALSTFLELKVFESQIVKRVQDLYLTRNEPVFADIRGYAESLRTRVEDERARLDSLRKEAGDLRNEEIQRDASLDSRLNAIRQELSNLEASPPSGDEELRRRQADEVRPIAAESGAIRAELGSLETDIADFRDRRNAEASGVNPENLDGISGKGGCGRRCEYWQAKLDAAVARRTELLARLAQLEAARQSINERYAQLVAEAVSAVQERVRKLTTERDAIFAEAQKKASRLEAEHDAQVARADTQIATAEANLRRFESGYFGDLDNYTKRREGAPDYVPFSDGPLDRLTALLDLKKEAVYGPTISWFSWWLKGFVIFLEVIPVVSKMFFSPPSVYGFRIRSAVAFGQFEQTSPANDLRSAGAVPHPAGITVRRSSTPSLMAVRRDPNPAPTGTSTRASPGVSPSKTRTVAGPGGSAASDDIAGTITRALKRTGSAAPATGGPTGTK